VADHVDRDPVPVAALVTACGADPDALDSVLGALAAHDALLGKAGCTLSRVIPTASPVRIVEARAA
jgi:hypothetical protein